MGVELREDDRHEDPDRLTEVAHDLLRRYEDDGDVDALRAAVATYERALAVLTADDDPWTFQSNLGNALRLAYERFGERALLDRSVAVLRSAESGLDGGEDHAFVLDNLALALRDISAATDDVTVLRQAVAMHERAVAQADPSGSECPRYLDNLGGAYWELHAAVGDAVLDRAGEVFADAVRLTSPDSPDLPLRLSNLATATHGRYRAGGDPALLDTGVSMARRAVGASGPTHIDRPRQLG